MTAHPSRRAGGTDVAAALDPGHPFATLMRLLAPHRGRLAWAVAIFAIKDSPVWLLPVITSKAVDVVVHGGPMGTLGWLSAGAAVLLIQNYPTHVGFTHLYQGAVRSIGADIRNTLTEHLQSLSIGFHSRSNASVLQNKIVRDVENIELMFSQAGASGLSAVFVLIGALVMTSVNVPQFLPVFALAVPCGAGIWWAMRRGSQARNEEFRRQMELYSARVGEMAAMIPVTRAHGLEHVATERVSQVAEDVRAHGLRLDMLNGRFGAASWVAMQLLSVGCLLLAAVFAVAHWVPITPGQVVLLGTYFSALTGTVTTVLNLVPILSRGGESVRSVAEVIQEPDLELNAGKREVASVAGRIELRDVTVRYESDATPALDRVNLVVEPGQTVAFVGRSGSGKSTLMNTILGFVRPTDGSILLDGRDMHELDLRTVRRHVAVVPQESVLFEGTIRDNIGYGMGWVSDERLTRALADANALEFVSELPDGIDTVVGERGARLSGGQRQRLSIARALIRDPRILMLDEATSALDTPSEAQIQTALARLMRDRTTFVVAHRLSTVRSADVIIVLDHGRIVEMGDHDELLAAAGRYAEAWQLQKG